MARKSEEAFAMYNVYCNWQKHLCWHIAKFVCLAFALLFAGCASGHNVSPKSAGAPLETGYDPAWSPDGSRIAYVQAVYEPAKDKDAHGVVWLANRKDDPAPRQAICIWNLHTNRRELVDIVFDKRTVITSLVWRSNDELLYLASRLSRDYYDRLKYKEDWHLLLPFRSAFVEKDLVSSKLYSKKASILPISPVRWIWNIEAGRGNTHEAILWGAASDQKNRTIYWHSTLTEAGNLGPREYLPFDSWNGNPWATARTVVPVGVFKDGKRKSDIATKCLTRIYSDRCEDFYGPGKAIYGVYGSPDGKHVALSEFNTSRPSDPCVALKVIPISGGKPVMAADDAWPWSYIAWSPDGKKIAYVKAKDGKIAIADVPSKVVSVESQK